MANRIYATLSIAVGIFFLFSFFSKVLILGDWLSFNTELVDSKIGYFNGIALLLIELFFAISFVTMRVNKNLLLSSFALVLSLTVIVMLNKDLFQSCMCFGKLISIKPDIYFVLKNAVLLLAILFIYLLYNYKLLIANKLSNEKN
jgi:hypothetical protein